MGDLQVRTKSGLKDASLDDVKRFVAEGKLDPTLKVVTLDGGRTFITARQAIAAAEEEEFEEEPGGMDDRVFKKMWWRRILLLIAAIVITICFFTPLFYDYLGSSPPKDASQVIWGWKTMWGLMIFIAGLIATTAVAVDLVFMRRIPELRESVKAIHFFTFSAVALLSVLAMMTRLLGFGVDGSNPERRGIPIFIVAIIGCAAWALVTVVMMVLDEKASQQEDEE